MNGGKRRYVRRKKAQRAEVRSETSKDISQDYDLQRLRKTVRGLTQSTKGWQQSGTAGYAYAVIPTIVGVASTSTFAAYFLIDPTQIAQGDVQGGRQGDYIKLNHIGIKYSVRCNVAPVSTQNGASLAVRVLAVCFHRPNGTPGTAAGSLVPTFEDLFTVQAVNMARGHLRALYNPETRTNAHVYYDRIHDLASTQIVTTSWFHEGRISIRPTQKNSIIKFNTTSGAKEGIEENMYVIIVMSDNATTSDAQPPEFSAISLTDFEQ